MDKKQGFLSVLKEEVIRGLSPMKSRARSASPRASSLRRRSPSLEQMQVVRSRSIRPVVLKEDAIRRFSMGKSRARSASPRASLLRRRSRSSEQTRVTRYGSYRPSREALAPLLEGPVPDGSNESDGRRKECWGSGIQQWMKGQLPGGSPFLLPSGHATGKRSDIRLLLGVMGVPLAPVHVCAADPLPHPSVKDCPIETSTAQYILQQYTAASGGSKLQSSIRNAYVMGKVKMAAAEFETATKVMKNKNLARTAECGRFVLWQMMPDMWYVELAVGDSKVHSGCNGKLVWRHTPWLGVHAAKGPVRPLRRALQGLDPRTTASMFATATCIGEKQLNGEDCFILKLSADTETLKARSEGPVEIIRHALFGYFSQRTGLLVHMEDTHLTRIESIGGGAVFWETTIDSFLDDYRPVEGVMIAHSGRSVVTLFRFGEMAMSHTKTKMEEVWTIEEVAFNVPGLSMDCFIPPTDIRCGPISEACEMSRVERSRNMGTNRSKVAAIGKPQDDFDNNIWRVEV